jgi:hypothetical protein
MDHFATAAVYIQAMLLLLPSFDMFGLSTCKDRHWTRFHPVHQEERPARVEEVSVATSPFPFFQCCLTAQKHRTSTTTQILVHYG